MRTKRLISSAFLGITLAVGVPLAFPAAANATNQVPCNQSDFLKVTLYNGVTNCFANAGATVVPIDYRQNVRQIYAGNNVTVVQWSNGTSDAWFTIQRWGVWYNNNPTGIFIKVITIQ